MKKIYFLVLALGLFMNVNAQVVNIPDQNLLNTLIWQSGSPHAVFYNSNGQPILNNSNEPSNPLMGSYGINSNLNGEIEANEAALVYKLIIHIHGGIVNLSGLNQFPNLQILELLSDTNYNGLQSLNLGGVSSTIKNLTIGANIQINNADLNHFPNIENLTIGNGVSAISFHANNYTSIKYFVSQENTILNLSFLNSLTNLESLDLFQCQLSSTNAFNNLSQLKHLGLSHNLFTSIDLTSFPNLQTLILDNNLFSSINLAAGTNLKNLLVGNNQLMELDLNNLDQLVQLQCGNNLLSVLDLNTSPITNLQCQNNLLTHLSVKNGSSGYMYFAGNPTLQYICADDAELADIQDKISQYGYTNCHVNTYCSFNPGGTFYTIAGNSKFDTNNDGCGPTDSRIPHINFNISDGVNTGILIGDFLGNYSIPVEAGTHTLMPVLENPNYFTISPSTINVTFPAQNSLFLQNFCVTANGIHPDVEIFISPIDRARPGFDARYSIVIKNKGNQVESGSVIFNFDDAKLDFVSSDVSPIQSTGTLTWNYTNLKPFGTKTFEVKLNVNSPMETPAVNGGDILTYNANITSANTDDMSSDNIFELKQTVVNSFDPNDITCLEGTSVTTAKIGDYVHYLIRFENTGTDDAINIVVKDVVDTAKFDINTIVPYDANYNYYTRIKDNNVEFVFENINLPFDDADNDGYLAFKVKIKSTLVAGDTFSKNASIYFDYNFPIVTNTATTTIAALAVKDFEFSNYFNIYPNPVHDVLHISAKETIEISSINIYNMLGQLVLVIPNAKDIKDVDVSELASGNYFIKIHSDKGTSNTRFSKN